MSATSTNLSDAFLELSGGFHLALETLSTQLDVVVTAQADEDREVAVTVSSELVVRLASLFFLLLLFLTLLFLLAEALWLPGAVTAQSRARLVLRAGYSSCRVALAHL
jgi:hypothetical protein